MGNVDTVIKQGRTHTQQVAKEILARWNIHWMWINGPTGHHAQGRAIDFMTLTANQGALRTAMGNEIAAYLRANHKRLGIEYIIWRQRIWNATRSDDANRKGWSQWRRMADRGNPTANHMDHPHVSLRNSPPAYRPPQPRGGGAKVSPPKGWQSPGDIRDTVTRGDNLTEISNYYSRVGGNVSVQEIVQRNNLSDPNRINIGQKLWIPERGFRGQSRRKLLSLSTLRAIAVRGTTEKFQDGSVRNVKWGLSNMYPNILPAKNIDGFWGPNATRAYSQWQKDYSKRHGLNWSGDDVNGIPGPTSLEGFADRFNFTVV